MSIRVNEDLILPDIPTDILEQYPYVVITKDGDNYVFCCSTSIYGYADYGILNPSYAGIFLIASLGLGSAYILSVDTGIWEKSTDYTSPGSNGFNATSGVLWVNHDIYEITSVDMSTGAYTTGDLYLAKSESVLEDNYSVPSEWMVSLAEHTRRLSGDFKLYDHNEMLGFLEGLSGMEGVLF